MASSLVYALGVSLSPVPIASILLILTGRHARANGISFAIGWTAGLAVVAIAALVAVRSAKLSASSSRWISIEELVVGAAFVLASAALLVRGRRRREIQSAWLEKLDELSPARVASVGVLLAGANPKVLALSLGAVLSLASVHGASSLDAWAIVPFVVIGATSVLVPFGRVLSFSAARRGRPQRVAHVADRA